ncbi:MAG: hypothetical protein KDA74_15285, partial [Planctomycetaceae bacterium]|nr:hypothetical protein [Planctomycetaceae bacterium]
MAEVNFELTEQSDRKHQPAASRCAGRCVILILFFAVHLSSTALSQESGVETTENRIHRILQKACFDCHNDDLAEGKLNLQQLDWKLDDQRLRQRWILAYDRIAAGEMPPDRNDLPQAEREQLLKELYQSLQSADAAEVAREGRGPLRRLTR